MKLIRRGIKRKLSNRMKKIIETDKGNSELDALNERIDSLISKTADLKNRALAKKTISEVVSLKTPPTVATSTPRLPAVQAPIVQQPIVQQPIIQQPIVQQPGSTPNYLFSADYLLLLLQSSYQYHEHQPDTNATSSALNSVGTSTFSNTIFVSELLFHATGEGGDVGKGVRRVIQCRE